MKSYIMLGLPGALTDACFGFAALDFTVLKEENSKHATCIRRLVVESQVFRKILQLDYSTGLSFVKGNVEAVCEQCRAAKRVNQ